MKKILRTLEKTKLQLSAEDIELLIEHEMIFSNDKKILSYNEFASKKSYTIKVDELFFLSINNGKTEFSKREENGSSVTASYESDPNYLLLNVTINKLQEKDEKLLLNISTMSDENFNKYYGYYLLTETCKKILKKEIEEIRERKKIEKKLREEQLKQLSSELSFDHTLAEVKVDRAEKDKLKTLLREVKSEEETLRKFSSDLKIP